jgi:pyrroline-5-carboxylate reductase
MNLSVAILFFMKLKKAAIGVGFDDCISSVLSAQTVKGTLIMLHKPNKKFWKEYDKIIDEYFINKPKPHTS